MKELVFLVEGEAERNLLDALMPRLLPDGIGHRVIPFQGKQDMEKRMNLRIRGYQNALARFIIMRDQDRHGDCELLKKGLNARCQETGREAHCLVRIACKELETFYLADLAAVGTALDMPSLARHQGRKKFRDPDNLASPSRELKVLTGNRYEKRAGSRAIGQHLDLENTRSPSFRNFLSGVRRLTTELLEAGRSGRPQFQ